MPYGGNDWLALTREPTLEPEIPICDPHHHFWDLRPERIPYQRYLLHELAADVHCGHHLRSTVFIETRAASLNMPHVRKPSAGPAARPKTPLAVENSVGEMAAVPQGRAPKRHNDIRGTTDFGSRGGEATARRLLAVADECDRVPKR
jgi:hypothetical protein